MSSGYYSDEDIDQFASQVTANLSTYPKKMTQAAVSLLHQRPSSYLRFGVYWWGLKSLIKKFFPNENSWFCGPYEDSVMEARADHGSEFRNVLAAWVYFENHPLEDPKSQWEDSAGVIHPYSLYDADSPV